MRAAEERAAAAAAGSRAVEGEAVAYPEAARGVGAAEGSRGAGPSAAALAEVVGSVGVALEAAGKGGAAAEMEPMEGYSVGVEVAAARPPGQLVAVAAVDSSAAVAMVTAPKVAAG